MRLELLPKPPADESKVREDTRALVDRWLRPHAIEDDERCHFRRDVFNQLAKAKLTAVSVPKKFGGLELSYRCYYAMLEEIARASVSMSVTVGVTNLIQGALVQFGSEEQKENYLTRLVSGELLGAFSLSEPGAGSDAASLRLAVTKRDGGYVLNGNKVWCSTAGDADLYLVMGRTSPDGAKGITSFLVPSDTKGFRVGKQEKKMGLRASSLAELVFENCFLPESARLAKEGEGLSVALSQLDAGRISIGAAGLAIALESLERVWKHGKRLGLISDGTMSRLGGHFGSMHAVRTLITAAATLRDEKQRYAALASSAKLLGSDLAMQASSDAVELLGPLGSTRELEVERLMRDAKALQIVEGTNQIQRLVLGREIERMLD